MEDRSKYYFVMITLFCAMSGFFAYSLGWRHGERTALDGARLKRAEEEYERSVRMQDPFWAEERSVPAASLRPETVCPLPDASPQPRAVPAAGATANEGGAQDAQSRAADAVDSLASALPTIPGGIREEVCLPPKP